MGVFFDFVLYFVFLVILEFVCGLSGVSSFVVLDDLVGVVVSIEVTLELTLFQRFLGRVSLFPSVIVEFWRVVRQIEGVS